MDATTTHSMHSLVQRLKETHPELKFEEAEEFSWSPETKTVFYTLSAPHAEMLLLHEVSHALLEHQSYSRDVELITMETAAWDAAKAYGLALPTDLKIEIDEDVAQDHLDTYREWLHARSTCPQCTASGYQTGASTYKCPACTKEWRVNEARICALRRYSIS